LNQVRLLDVAQAGADVRHFVDGDGFVQRGAAGQQKHHQQQRRREQERKPDVHGCL